MVVYASRASSTIQTSRRGAQKDAKKTLLNNKFNKRTSLVDVPAAYIRDRLAAKGPQLLKVLRSYKLSHPTSGQLPKELEILMNDGLAMSDDGPPPSHCLAAYNNHKASSHKTVKLFPAHSLVLLANCSNLPSLPMHSETSKIPVVPINLPSPETFGILLTYLYNKDTSFWTNNKHTDALDIKRRAFIAEGVRQNCIVLGVQDVRLAGVVRDAILAARS